MHALEIVKERKELMLIESLYGFSFNAMGYY